MDNALDNQVAVIEKQTYPLLAQSASYSIENAGDVENASVFLRDVSDAIKSIEAKRLEFTKPLNQSLKAINSTFKQLKSPLEGAKKELSTRILKWRSDEEQRVRKEQARRRKIQDAHEKQGHEVQVPVVMKTPEKTIGNTQIRKVWKFELVAFSKVGDEFKSLNTVAVNGAIRKGKREIAGLRIYQEETMAVV